MALLRSDRHKRGDLEHWKDLLCADKKRFGLQSYKRAIDRAVWRVSDFHERKKGRYYVCTSWGKDSVMVLHLFVSQGIFPRTVYIRNLKRENPECLPVRDEFLFRWPDIPYEEVVYDYDNADATWFDQKGRPIKWYQVLRDLRDRYGIHVTGVRACESTERLLRYGRYGVESKWSFAPLGVISTEDVFAYLAQHDLPTNAVYAMTGGGRWDRHKLRVAAIGNERGKGFGREEWEREYFGDIVARIQQRGVLRSRNGNIS